MHQDSVTADSGKPSGFIPGVSNTRPARAFCAARDAFWEIGNN